MVHLLSKLYTVYYNVSSFLPFSFYSLSFVLPPPSLFSISDIENKKYIDWSHTHGIQFFWVFLQYMYYFCPIFKIHIVFSWFKFSLILKFSGSIKAAIAKILALIFYIKDIKGQEGFTNTWLFVSGDSETQSGDIGCCGSILMFLSFILVVATFPFSLFFCIKVI